MIRGTTASLDFGFDIPVSDMKNVWISFFQNGNEVMTKTLDDIETVEGEENSAKVRFSQEDTLKFESGKVVSIQIRMLDVNDNAYASKIMTMKVDKILKDGVIS